MKTAIYPGSFDPITNGHLDVVRRATALFDRVIVAVAENPEKHPLFTPAERVRLVRAAVRNLRGVEVEHFTGLLVAYARRKKAVAIIRGLRAVSDFEYELQFALMNRKLAPDVETIFLAPKAEYTFVSSRMIKEIARLGGRIGCFVPPEVETALRRKLSL